MNVVRKFLENHSLKGEVVVDDMDNALDAIYEAKPERLYIIKDGLVRYRGGLGPFFYQLDQLEMALDELTRARANSI